MRSLRDAKNEWRKSERRWWRAIKARDYDLSDKLRGVATKKHSIYVNHSHYDRAVVFSVWEARSYAWVSA